jgi:AcrR family transcriptional regulator
MVRPRSLRAHTSVLDAAQALFAERGIDATSMDAIAAASGVSKATIYKHWPDKDALCLEVMVRIHGRDDAPDFDSGDLRTDLIHVLGHRPPERYATLREQLTPHLLAHCARNPAFAEAWRKRALHTPRTQLLAIVRRAIDRGELPDTLDPEFAVAMLFGPMLYGWVVAKAMAAEGELPKNAHELVVETFMRAYGPDLRAATPPAARPPDRSASRAARGSRSRAARRPAGSSPRR